MYGRLCNVQNLDGFSIFWFKFPTNKIWTSPKTLLKWTLNQRLIKANKVWWPPKRLKITSWKLSLMSYLDFRFLTVLESSENRMLARCHTNFQVWKSSSFCLCKTKTRTKKILNRICVLVFWSYVLILATVVILGGKNALIFLFWEGRGGRKGEEGSVIEVQFSVIFLCHIA